MCKLFFYITALRTNEVLVQTNFAAALSEGSLIVPDSAPNDFWWARQVSLVTHCWSPANGTSRVIDPLATMTQGYIGIRFWNADGIHYGWIRIREMVVLDWAYETRAGTPIKAGA